MSDTADFTISWLRFSFLGFVGNDGNSGSSLFIGSSFIGGREGSGGRDGPDGNACRGDDIGRFGTPSFFLNNPITILVLFLFYRFIVILE